MAMGTAVLELLPQCSGTHFMTHELSQQQRGHFGRTRTDLQVQPRTKTAWNKTMRADVSYSSTSPAETVFSSVERMERITVRARNKWTNM